MSDVVLYVVGALLIGMGLGGAAVRIVAAHEIRFFKALLRQMERELYSEQRRKAVVR
jgi:galactokinase